MKISACWIVKNEAVELAKSIISVKECADEFIVVDTGSTDDTVRIAKKYGAEVKHFKWADDFSLARNFALSFATGDYVIFLDADEYFEPALTVTDRITIFNQFEKNPVDTLQINRIELNADMGTVIGEEPHARILKRSSIHYKNRIHELAVTKDGTPPNSLLLRDFRIMHTGYSSNRVTEKYLRNISYLETEQKELRNAFSLFHNHAYLMREYMAIHDYEKAFTNCRYLLDHYEQWEIICETFSTHYIQRFYTALQLMLVKRFSFSRKEVFKKLVSVAKEIYREFKDSLVLELYYQMIADYRGDLFLQKLEFLDQCIDMPKAIDSTENKNAEASIYGRGALEAYYRGNHEKASLWAKNALKIMPEYNQAVLTAILNKSFLGTDDISKNIIQKNFEEAYHQIQKKLESNPLDYTMLEFLQMIADNTSGNLSEDARKLYDTRRDLLDIAIDLSDVVNTEYVDSDAPYIPCEATEDILELSRLAAPIYEKNKKRLQEELK